MHAPARRILQAGLVLGLCLAILWRPAAAADSRNLAPGFSHLPRGAKLVVMPPDVELFSISAGGVQEPKADWTEAAHRHIHEAVSARSTGLGLAVKELPESESDELAEVNALHAAVARSIALHHMGGGNFALPTKANKLDWSLGEAVQPIRAKSDADYALFIWMRDSYATAERKVTMVALAFLGVGVVGGMQIGYASLVDLRSGQVVWFNRLLRSSGDLREAQAAGETVGALLAQFPETR